MKYTLLILSLSSLLLTVACKPNKEEAANQSTTKVQADPTKPRKYDATNVDFKQLDKAIPNTCELVSPAFIANVFGISADIIEIKDASNNNNNKARSCFFKWQSDLPNSGILVQCMKNPVEEHFEQWVSHFISTKIKEGEKEFGGSGQSFNYDKWSVVGDEGAYSTDAGKYYWRIGEEFVFMLAFNVTLDAVEQQAAAETLSREIMSNFKRKS